MLDKRLFGTLMPPLIGKSPTSRDAPLNTSSLVTISSTFLELILYWILWQGLFQLLGMYASYAKENANYHNL
jgi:hypothetical protein